ncbi:hypothetical protein BH10CYA1_BH10CYA1_32670 [soil metagenome]
MKPPTPVTGQCNFLGSICKSPQSGAAQLVQLIQKGEIADLEDFVWSFQDCVDEFVALTSIGVHYLNTRSLEIQIPLPQKLARDGKVYRVAVLTVISSAKWDCRSFSICTDKRWTTTVLEGTRDGNFYKMSPSSLDVGILLRQIASQSRINVYQPPPPLQMKI